MLAVIAAMTASIGSIQASAVTENATQIQVECKGDPGYGISTQSGVNYFRLTDPYRGKVGLSSVYNVKTSDIYTITRNHWAKHFLY